jgi:hypothetical protein
MYMYTRKASYTRTAVHTYHIPHTLFQESSCGPVHCSVVVQNSYLAVVSNGNNGNGNGSATTSCRCQPGIPKKNMKKESLFRSASYRGTCKKHSILRRVFLFLLGTKGIEKDTGYFSYLAAVLVHFSTGASLDDSFHWAIILLRTAAAVLFFAIPPLPHSFTH